MSDQISTSMEVVVAATSYHPVAHADEPRVGDEAADRQPGVALAGDRAQDIEVARDAAGLLARGHHAALDPHADVDRRLADRDPAADERVLPGPVEQHVGAEATRVPARDRRRGDEREAG